MENVGHKRWSLCLSYHSLFQLVSQWNSIFDSCSPERARALAGVHIKLCWFLFSSGEDFVRYALSREDFALLLPSKRNSTIGVNNNKLLPGWLPFVPLVHAKRNVTVDSSSDLSHYSDASL